MMKFKYVIKNTAWAVGKTATFMPKPIFGDNGSGMHTHQSLWKDGEPLFYDERGYGGLSDIARWYIGGLLKHAPRCWRSPTRPSTRTTGSSPATRPRSTSSTRRGTARPASGSRSLGPRRMKRIEFRIPDPSCNPYLAFAAQLMAGLDGIKNRIEPPEPVDRDLYELPPEEHAEIAQVPGSLPEVLAASEADHDYLLGAGSSPRDLISTWVEWKQERGRPDPVPAAPARVRDVLRHLTGMTAGPHGPRTTAVVGLGCHHRRGVRALRAAAEPRVSPAADFSACSARVEGPRLGSADHPRSVTTASMSRPGDIEGGVEADCAGRAHLGAQKVHTSAPSRISMWIWEPSAVARSTVDHGAATTNGMPASRAASARLTDPILLAVSPLRAIRSAPMSTASTRPRRIVDAAAPSAWTTYGICSWASSQAVSRAPGAAGGSRRHTPARWRVRQRAGGRCPAQCPRRWSPTHRCCGG